MTSTLSRGLAAGAVGTTVLNTVTWLDVLVTGRPPSDSQVETTGRVLQAAGITPASDPSRRTAQGTIGGIVAGLGVGVVASTFRSLGLRVPAPVGAILTGAAAMAATDLPMAATGVSDPRTWSRQDWLRDALPHAAYGVGVRWTLDRLTENESAETVRERHPVTAGLLVRSTLLGAASGGRSSLGLGGPLSSHGALARTAALGLVGTELVADKLPGTPSRLVPPVLLSRAGAGGLGAGVLARREQANPVLPVVAGMVGALAGSLAGASWREVSRQRGYTWQAAVAEDVAALGLSWLAVRGSSR